jgi:hypothetical protein
MSFNGSGTFLINTAGQPVVSGTVISSTAFNALTADLATGLSTAITKDGQTTVTANIPMSTYKFTGLGVGSAATDSANLSQVQSTVTKLLTSVSGTDTITAVGAPVVAAYAAGQMFYFVATGDNTGAVTLNIDSLGAKAVTRDGSVALAAGDIKSGEVVVVVYDGTRFQVVSQLNSAGNATFANVSITSALNVGGVATFSAGTAAAPSITTTGDTNTGIFFPAADTIAFTEGGVEAARFDSSGNLGIGTASPATKLNVVGTVTVDGVVDVNGGQIDLDTGQPIRWGGAASSIYAGSGTSDMVFTVGSSERFRVNGSSGNFGIGTSSPTQKLDVNGGAAVTGTTPLFLQRAVIPSFDGQGAPALDWQFYSTGTTYTVGARIQGLADDAWSSTSAPTSLRFYTAPSGSTSVSERMRISNAGNLGLGVTPSAWASGYKAIDVNSKGFSFAGGTESGAISVSSYWDFGWKYAGTTTFKVSQYQQFDGAHSWYNAPSGTAGNAISFTQAMTLDANGNLGVGTTSPYNQLESTKSGGSTIGIANSSSGANILYGKLAFYSTVAAGAYAEYGGQIRSYSGAGIDYGDLRFYTGNGAVADERARITAGGYSKFSNTGAYQDSAGSYHEFRSNGAAGEYTAIIGNSTSTDANAFGVRILYGNADPNGTGNQFLNCADWNGSSIVTRAEIRSNGGLANYQANNVDLSDARTKKDIIPAASMWGKVSALEIVTYKYNDQTHDDVNLGVIAQQVETVEPVWVDADGFGDTPEDGVPIKTVYTKDITFAAIKALQEAMARIEQLEAKVATLESK